MTTPTDHAAASGSDSPVGAVKGDRFCIACGFNLHGQVILREPHYRLLIVRCPECAQVASVQDYPVLGRWARRWGFMLAALYLLLTVGGLLLASLGAGAFSIEAAQQHRYGLCNDIAAAHRAWFEASKRAAAINQANPAPQTPAQQNLVLTTTQAVNQWGPFAAVDRAWWDAEGRASVLETRRKRVLSLKSDDLAAYTFFSVACFLGAAFFACILPGLRGPRLLALPILVVGLACLLPLCFPQTFGAVGGPWLPGFVSASELAEELTPGRFPILLLLGAGVVIAAGAFLGRPLARGLVRLFLPPRHAASLGFLWEADGRTFRPRKPVTRAAAATE